MNMIPEIRRGILSGLIYGKATFDNDDVDSLVSRCAEKNPERPYNYGNIAARNWSIDQHRNREFAIKQQRERIESEREIIKERALYLASRSEAEGLISSLAMELTPVGNISLNVAYLTLFRRENDNMIAERHPGSQREQRYQWKRRGTLLLSKYGSSELNTFINLRKGAHSK